MARPTTGSIQEHATKSGQMTRTLRFNVNGQPQRKALGVVSRDDAERELAYVLADVARGTWRPSEPAPPRSPGATPGFHDFADEWWQLKRREITEGTQGDYMRRLENHLIPFLEETPLEQIKVDTIDRYKAEKLGKGLSPRTVNMHLILLSAVLESAVERELIVANPAKGKRRRVKERKPQRSYLDNATQINALLDAAGELDATAQPHHRHIHRRAMLAVLIFAGLRLSEMLELRWSEVDLPAGWLNAQGTKTDQAVRRIKIRGALRDELVALKVGWGTHRQPGYVFPSSSGQRLGTENFRNRVFAAAVKRANENLERARSSPLPEKLTPQSLRRTFASLLYALGESPPVVMAEMGHADASLALRIYAQAMRREESERSRLRAMVEGTEFMSIDVNETESTQTRGSAGT